MTERNIGLEILEGIQEIKSYKAGKTKLKTLVVKELTTPLEIRQKLNLTQTDFAGLMGVSVRTVQEWEQGRRKPSGAARSLLRIAEQHPEAFLNAT